MGPKELKFITMTLSMCLQSNLHSGAARTKKLLKHLDNPSNPAAVDSCRALHIIVGNYMHLETFIKAI